MKTLLLTILWLLYSVSALAHPGSGIYVDSHGDVYVSDIARGLLKFAPDGSVTVVMKEAGHWLTVDADRAFASMEGRCEVARVHLELGTLARARGAPLTVVEHHLHEALRGFRELALPRYIERVERFAAELDMPLETGH